MLMQQTTGAGQTRLNELLDRQSDYVSGLAAARAERAMIEKRLGSPSAGDHEIAVVQLGNLGTYNQATTAKLAETRRNIAELRAPELAPRPVITPRP